MTYGSWNADNALRVTVVDGTTRTGLYAPDGSINVTAPAVYGLYHPCGAYQVTVVTTTSPRYASDGSLNITLDKTIGNVYVSVVSGSLPGTAPAELREDGGFELREDGGKELRE